ncbi:carboxypeptidase-like regulatory domain-containing protein [Winogradskyella immobilis]|uniref:Carboxypeptidase-like regulatory domain-containing protein n=1 Tax=Winogradskyella immobilis TaxID=2816852 RepID=A0ABS8ELH7_9FLAO|nr:carboxypeptidase-like regulatory domain-containing protein [Winogradskyella immobilis]MCC1483945.1 carboxypeptidase-like regulatory domain-containing protein [Winogradskyella immobilis]MCG0016037.1 carboxypeptidase-like regulatory domain-containing protein [Winogradskyella immobilis]
MKQHLLFIALFFSIGFISAQNIERIEISGRIVIATEEKEGITVFNESSNRGTVTDEKGAFTIEVALNETLVFSALQFKKFKITIDERIIDSKKVLVQLVEKINRLDEVIILPYDLSGNLNVDLEAVRTYNVDIDKIYIGIQDLDDYNFTEDYLSKINNPLVENRLLYGLNIVNIVGLFVRQNDKLDKNRPEASELTKRFTPNYLLTYLNIPTDRSEAFIDFVESKTFDQSLLNKNKELQLLEHLLSESKLFLEFESEN